MERMKEAVLLCLEVESEATAGELKFVGVQKIAV
jgi:hypothetical protein